MRGQGRAEGVEEIDYSALSLQEMEVEREHLHDHLLEEMQLVRNELNLILDVALVTLLLPIS